ncbi:MAG: DUF262 domain-containing protein [Bdellovibrionaceae bacterium]|nr:DUF262 domain-containing protein [Pseudobdellovibrionaceae bacterium]
MSTPSMFDSTKDLLETYLAQIKRGELQLPDFQRGWVWDDEHIRELLASVCSGYPVGAVMLLETGNKEVKFKTRPVEGVNLQQVPEPEQLVLDGQQRLTSLFQSTYQPNPVNTIDSKKYSIKRFYYVDIDKALDSANDRYETIVSISETKQKKNFRGEIIEDYSTPEAEFKAGLFPLNQVFDCSNWRMAYNSYWNHAPEKVRKFDEFEKVIINKFKQYHLPVITISKKAPKEAICQVFEKVNTGGVALNVFELLTATFAADDFNLRDDWAIREAKLKKHRTLAEIKNTEFLQSLTLLTSYHLKKVRSEAAITCKKKDVLRLSLEDYKRSADAISFGYDEAAKFLHQIGIFNSKDLPYSAQLVPMAAVFAVIDKKINQDAVRQKISRWFWCGVFGELYGGANETRFAKDLPELLGWIDGGSEPSTVSESSFNASRLWSLRTRNSAAYKGLSALLIVDRCLDFMSGKPIDHQIHYDENIDIHHIFPRKYCESVNIPPARYNSIINKTPIAAATNRSIGGKAPSKYLETLKKRYALEDGRMIEILRTHVIDKAHLDRDDFDSFTRSRMEGLIKRIENAIGKSIVRDDDSSPLEPLDSNDYADSEVQDEA